MEQWRLLVSVCAVVTPVTRARLGSVGGYAGSAVAAATARSGRRWGTAAASTSVF
jgi:hypothetical protein